MPIYLSRSKELPPGEFMIATTPDIHEENSGELLLKGNESDLAESFVAMGVIRYLEDRNRNVIYIANEED